jgi:hypothetical protein
MSQPNTEQSKYSLRKWLSTVIVFSSIGGIIITAALAMYYGSKEDNSERIFTMLLPVFTSWVGTVMAFYYGKENFSAANQETRELLKEVSQPSNKPEISVKVAMRSITDMKVKTLSDDTAAQTTTITDLKNKLSNEASRLPILNYEKHPLYMLHSSIINSVPQNDLTQSLSDFIVTQKQAGKRFGVNYGFVVVSENSVLSDAKEKMLKQKCQDIFVTKEGSADEPLVGWISNIRLAKFMDA